MKKTFIVIFTSLIFTHFVGAQTIEEEFPADRLGIRGGYNFSKIDSDLGANTVRRRNMHAGIFYQRYLTNNFALQPELQYSSEGWIEETGSGDDEAIMHFANLTIVGKFFLVQGFNMQAGIQPTLIIDATKESGGTGIVQALDEQLRRFNLSAVFGIGYDFGFGLNLGGRYVQGLIDINDGYNAKTKSNEIKTTSFQVYVGYSFALPGSDDRMNYGQ